jgi:hypothetical protein
MDTAPYPGPSHLPRLDFKEVQAVISKMMAKFTVDIDPFTEALKALEASMKEPIPPKTLEQKRKHALDLVQNRNTGPTPSWGFDHYGRRTF